MAVETRTSFCRICEAHCGILVDVEDNRVLRIRGDDDHPGSEGYLCPKGSAFGERFHHRQDRVTRPLRRVGGPGGFEPVSWDEALSDIASRLKEIRRANGADTIALYLGNPASFNLAALSWAKGFIDAIGSRQFHTVAAQDTLPRQVASAALYGSHTTFPFPDVARTDFCLVVGANPLVTHGSLVTNPRFPRELRDVVRRGGRVVVIDPVRTRTAEAFEHLAPRPDTDVWLLAAMISEAFRIGGVDRTPVSAVASGLDELEAAVSSFTPEVAAEMCDLPAGAIRSLARDFAGAERAVAYGRVGLCRGLNSTIANYLLDCLNVVTGNLDRPGGWMFGNPSVRFDQIAARLGLEKSGQARTPADGLTDRGGMLPWTLPDDLTTSRPGRIRALVTCAGNPVVSAPGSDQFTTGLAGLDLMVSVDMVVNETTRWAHYLLPTTSFLERADMPLIWAAGMARVVAQHTDPVVERPPLVREEWEIFQELAVRMGLGGAYSLGISRALARLGLRPGPGLLSDGLLRTGPHGDLYGLRRRGPRLSARKLRRHPHGVLVGDHDAGGRREAMVHHKDRRVRLGDSEVLSQLGRLVPPPLGTPSLVGRRNLRAINSWIQPDQEPALLMNPADAEALGIAGGDRAELGTDTATIEVPVEVDDRVRPGVVSYPHGWGGLGQPGANVNRLASARPEDKETVSGNSRIDGLPVRIRRIAVESGLHTI